MRGHGGTCRYRSYRTSLMVSVLVPKAPGLKGKDAAMFRDFTAFIKAHELEHAQRWQSCLAAMDKQALAFLLGIARRSTARRRGLSLRPPAGALQVTRPRISTSRRKSSSSPFTGRPRA
ncbi:MAG: DUF922 domain-containing protein [Hyphomicrobiales bacterium]